MWDPARQRGAGALLTFDVVVGTAEKIRVTITDNGSCKILAPNPPVTGQKKRVSLGVTTLEGLFHSIYNWVFWTHLVN